MIKGILLTENSIEVISAEDKLNVWYTILNCSCIDIVTRKINDNYYDIICDDEGLLKEKPILRGIEIEGREILTGNIFICNSNDEGELMSLTNDDIKLIKRKVFRYTNGEVDIPVLSYTF